MREIQGHLPQRRGRKREDTEPGDTLRQPDVRGMLATFIATTEKTHFRCCLTNSLDWR